MLRSLTGGMEMFPQKYDHWRRSQLSPLQSPSGECVFEDGVLKPSPFFVDSLVLVTRADQRDRRIHQRPELCSGQDIDMFGPVCATKLDHRREKKSMKVEFLLYGTTRLYHPVPGCSPRHPTSRLPHISARVAQKAYWLSRC
jgi:hypothetical protein